jgi:hypothetical protein
MVDTKNDAVFIGINGSVVIYGVEFTSTKLTVLKLSDTIQYQEQHIHCYSDLANNTCRRQDLFSD